MSKQLMAKYHHAEGNLVYFEKKDGGMWKAPLEMTQNSFGAVETALPGRWYQVTIDGDRLLAMETPPDRPYVAGGPPTSTRGNGQQTPTQGVSPDHQSLRIMANVVIKALVESGKQLPDPSQLARYVKLVHTALDEKYTQLPDSNPENLLRTGEDKDIPF